MSDPVRLVQYKCPRCGCIIGSLPGSQVFCPDCEIWYNEQGEVLREGSSRGTGRYGRGFRA